MNPRTTLPEFDVYLASKGLTLEAVAIGGVALSLLGIVQRETQDCDILHPELPEEVRKAAQAFAAQARERGLVLKDDWLNNGPASLGKVLPEGWLQRAVPLFSGSSIRLSVLGRADLLKSKLFALCDRGRDVDDCIAMAPTKAELDEALPWVQHQDAHEKWPAYVVRVLDDLKRRLGHV